MFIFTEHCKPLGQERDRERVHCSKPFIKTSPTRLAIELYILYREKQCIRIKNSVIIGLKVNCTSLNVFIPVNHKLTLVNHYGHHSAQGPWVTFGGAYWWNKSLGKLMGKRRRALTWPCSDWPLKPLMDEAVTRITIKSNMRQSCSDRPV